jgi:hypothetical protein
VLSAHCSLRSSLQHLNVRRLQPARLGASDGNPRHGGNLTILGKAWHGTRHGDPFL